MIPKSVSATSLTTARECLKRFWAENIEFARGWTNDPARNGSCCHSALQRYVDEVYLKKTHAPDAARLSDYYELFFLQEFGISDEFANLREAGMEMMEKWSAREAEHFAGRTVINLEEKTALYIESSIGPIKLNYILDRFDTVGPNRYEIIDYKSQHKNVTTRTILKDYMQPDIYALAKYIEHPDAESMFVTFDMLRYDLVTIEITKERSRAFFADICKTIEEIIATDAQDAPETLNKSCNYCIRKAGCATLQRNIDVGGLFSLTLEEQIDLRTQIDLQVKGLTALTGELDSVVEETLGKDLKMELKTPSSRAYFTTGQENKIRDFNEVEQIVGTETFFRYGKKTMTLKEFDKMVKDPLLTDDQRTALKALKEKKWKDPKINYENTRGEEASAVLAPDVAGKLAPAQPRQPILGLD